MLFRIKTYLNFLLRSTNQHGVHSPFVYNLVTKCFYKQSDKNISKRINIWAKETQRISISAKKIKLIHRIITYLNLKQGFIKSDSKEVLRKYFELDTYLIFSETDVYDFIYTESKNVNSEALDNYIDKTHNNSFMIINHIHKDKQSLRLWSQLKNHPKVQVTIESYNLGFIFFRKEQVEEHFVIRL